MRAFTRLSFWRTLCHRLAAASVALAYLLSALDVPLPAFVHKDASVPFPCQNHPCGCRTAEQCWSHCCCFTPEERWAWAREHGVEPPSYAEMPASPPVEEPAEQGWNTVKLRDREAAKAKPAAKNCCHKQSGRSECCSSDVEATNKQSTENGGAVSWGSVLAVWHCQGWGTIWLSTGAVLPVPPPDDWSPDTPPPSRLVLADTFAFILSSPPPSPPPRRSLG